MEICKQDVDEALLYDQDRGVFLNRVTRGARSKKGEPAGTKTTAGYVRIKLNGHPPQLAHRLVWLTMTGSMPKGVIDHINGNGLDNRFVNLRDVCHAENIQNQFRPHGGNPYIGATLVRGKWQSTVTRFGISFHLGLFDTPEEASLAYQNSKTMNHQEFASAARNSRRKNKLTSELLAVLKLFPGFDCTEAERNDWLLLANNATA